MMKTISSGKARGTALALVLSLGLFLPVAMGQDPSIKKSLVRLAVDGSYLGIEMEEVTADNMSTHKLSGERGAIVRAVEKGSPAEAANIQEKDVILEFAGTPVLSTMQLARLVQETPSGRKVDLVVNRDGKKVNLTVKVGKREDSWSSQSPRSLRRDDRNREFWFDGPEGRLFRFGIPEGGGGGGFALGLPDRKEITGKPRLGATLDRLTDQMGEFLGVPGKKGALVTMVSEGSPAAAAKLRAGDVIVKADSRTVEDPEDLQQIVGKMESGRKLELRVIREKKEISVTVELAKEEKRSSGYKM